MPGNKKKRYTKRVKKESGKYVIVGSEFDKKRSDVKKYLLISVLALLVILTTIASLNFNNVKSWFAEAQNGSTTTADLTDFSAYAEYRFGNSGDYNKFTSSSPLANINVTTGNYLGNFSSRIIYKGNGLANLRVKLNEVYYMSNSVVPNLGISNSYTLADGWHYDAGDGYYYYHGVYSSSQEKSNNKIYIFENDINNNYKLVTSFYSKSNTGRNYLIVNSNVTGKAYALKKSISSSQGSAVAYKEVTVNFGDYGSGNVFYITNSDNDDSIVWNVSRKGSSTVNSARFTIKNGSSDYLLADSDSIKVYNSFTANSNIYWSYSNSNNQLKFSDTTVTPSITKYLYFTAPLSVPKDQTEVIIPFITSATVDSNINSIINVTDANVQMRLDVVVETVQLGRSFSDFRIPPASP